MFPWLWIWSPQLHYPWSGSVAQHIDPDTNWFFGAIAPASGNAAIERKAFEVASYGRQLGLITELLLDLAAQQAPASPKAKRGLERLREIQARIEAVKEDVSADTVQTLAAQAKQLQQRDPQAYAALLQRLTAAATAPTS